MSAIFLRWLPRLMVGICTTVFVLGLSMETAQATEAWKNMRGYSTCGGLDQSGRLQRRCAAQRATFVGQSLKKCPAGSFQAQGLCYSCPAGFKHDLLRKGSDERACVRNVSNSFEAATFQGRRECPAGSFIDPRNGGECWSCPAGYGRTAAAVDAWNACGAIGKQAVSAEFTGKACRDGFGDPRNGGECWSCPEGTDRTISPVNGPRACQRSFEFAEAVQTGDFQCGAGEIFDLIDGGTCWTCPDQYQRSWSSIKAADACVTTEMDWVMPERQGYGIFGLGAGAEDIIARLITERTELDAAIAKIAVAAEEDVATASATAWEVIENRPWESAVLTSALLVKIMDIADKPAGERSRAEADLLARVGQIVQWNRQFIAYQARQAYEAHGRASEKFFDETTEKMGAATVYATNPVTPPDYNDVLMNSLQLGAGGAGGISAILVSLSTKSTRAIVFPFRRAGKKAAEEAVKFAAKKVLQSGVKAVSSATGVSTAAMAAAAGPMLVAGAVAVMMTIEIEKYMKIEEAEGKIRQAINIANRPVDLALLLQQEGGSDELMFHWAAVMNGETRPSANFTRLLAAYKAGTTPTAAAVPPSVRPDANAPTANTTTSTGATAVQGGLSGVMNNMLAGTVAPTQTPTPTQSGQASAVSPEMQAFLARLEAAVSAPARRQPGGSLKVELSSQPGQCLTTIPGDRELRLMDCGEQRILSLQPDARTNAIRVEGFCMDAETERGPGQRVLRNYPVLAECDRADRGQRWQLTREGFIQLVQTDQCISLHPQGDGMIMITCGAFPANQTWRPWSGRS